MKKAAIAAAVLLAAALLSPWLLGMQTEAMIRRNVAAMDEHAVYAFTVESYERHWFSSTARISAGFGPSYAATMSGLMRTPAGAALAGLFGEAGATFDLAIEHGPVGMGQGLFVGLSRITAMLNRRMPAEAQDTGADYLARLRGRVGFSGSFDFVIDMPATAYADDTGELDFSGARIEGTYAGRRLAMRGGIDTLTFTALAGTASIEGIELVADNEILSPYLATGDVELAIHEAMVHDAFGSPLPLFAASNIKITSASGLDDTGSLFSADVLYSADAISGGAGEVDIGDVELGFVGTNFHVETIKDYNELMLGIDPLDDTPPVAALLSLAEKALAHGPTFAIKPLKFRYFDEPFEASIEVRTNPDALANGIDLSNPLALATVLAASATARASKTLASRIATEALKAQLGAAMANQSLPPGQDIDSMAQAQAALLLATSLGQGYIVADGDDYVTAVDYANGQITINGNALALPIF